MDWVFKASSSSWDLSELERDEFDVLVMENNQTIDAFSVDCGILGDSTMASPHPLPESGSGSGSGKKPRNEQQQQVSSCLVDGCRADLSSCREYHRRHRVCEAHSKTPVVAIGGKDQRFCQQCSRFHSVGEFDDVKRSCRKRLDGHNRRRRKPRPGVHLHNYQTFFTNHQSTKLLHFGGGGGAPPYTWPNKEKSHHQLHRRPPPPPPPSSSSLSSSSSREIKFPFLLGTDASLSVGQISYNGALSLLSNNTSDSTLIAPHLPFTTNNHLIKTIHFQTQGLELENYNNYHAMEVDNL